MLILLLKLTTAYALAQTPAAEPLEYDLLGQTIAIDSLRSGNHDESGVNDYVFHGRVYGLLNSSEERNLAFEKRKKLEVDLGSFGATKIDALSTWKADEKTKDVKELTIEGNAVRELVARTMTELKVTEGDVAVMVELEMTEKNKRFFFLGEDTVVGKASYHIIAPTKFDVPARTNVALAITDDKGTLVKLTVRYAKPATAAAVKKSEPAPVGTGSK